MPNTLAARYPMLAWVGPFAAFLFFLVIQSRLEFLGAAEYPLRAAILGFVIWFCSRGVLSLRVERPWLSIAVGLGVFLVWIAPDQLIPGYRSHWLFQNGVMGKLEGGIPAALRTSTLVLVFRFLRASVIVPIIEELFWRGWLMRWLIQPKFEDVPLGQFESRAFWITAVLFAAEHGPYWEVGLLAGIAYNWLMVRTRSLGDCILAHAVTNAVLSGWVIATGQWQYWS